MAGACDNCQQYSTAALSLLLSIASSLLAAVGSQPEEICDAPSSRSVKVQQQMHTQALALGTAKQCTLLEKPTKCFCMLRYILLQGNLEDPQPTKAHRGRRMSYNISSSLLQALTRGLFQVPGQEYQNWNCQGQLLIYSGSCLYTNYTYNYMVHFMHSN